MREYGLVLLVTAAATFVLVPLVRRFAFAVGAVPPLRPRDVHTEPTPLLGGLAMFGGMVAGLLVASRLTNLQDPFQAAGSKTQSGLLLAGGLIVVIGFIDDRWELSALSKLAGQVAAAGILWWSGLALPWLPEPGGHELILQPSLSITLTILLVVVTINAVNFIDGMDGLAAGIVAVTATGFLFYSYALSQNLGSPSLSLPAVSSAVLAGMCIGFLPHNFYPARIFMGDIGAMLLGLLLAYGPISATASIDPAVLVNYAAPNHPVNRFGTFLPLLVPAAIFLIPYTDLMLAVIRRTRRGKPLMAADKEHLHHRLMTIGHSYRQSVLIMWLWAALLSAIVVALSLGRTHLWVLASATVAAVLLLLPVTMPSLRPWRLFARPAPGSASASASARASGSASSPAASPTASPAPLPATSPAPLSASATFAAAPVASPRATPRGGHAGSSGGHATPNGANGTAGRSNGTTSRSNGRAGRFNAGPGRSNGRAGRSNGAAAGGPPPGFEPMPAPPGLNGDGSAHWRPGHGNGSPSPSANGSGKGGESFRPLPDEPEPGLRPFPGDTGHIPPLADPFPRAGRLPDAPAFPDTPAFPGAASFPDTPAFPDVSPFPDASQVPGGSAFTDDSRAADDTDQFPTASHGDPR
jgi:UDP-GlcNAc:undecaprenyl-phosphate/decaprenyl-phosphate GlcNAc-1-phosphate transferase